MSIFDDLDDRRKHEITREQYVHSREVLPPVVHNFTFDGERWGFGFAEGWDYVYAFRREGDRYYARKTPFVNPVECGRTIDEQQQRPEPPILGKLSARHLDAALSCLRGQGCAREAEELEGHILALERERAAMTQFYEEVVIPRIEGQTDGQWTVRAAARPNSGERTP